MGKTGLLRRLPVLLGALLLGCNAFWTEYYRKFPPVYTGIRVETVPASEKTFRVHRVVDGATLEVWNRGRIETIRIGEVVAPPLDTVRGQMAKDALRYLEQKSVTIDVCPKKDMEGRRVGNVFHQGRNIGEAQLGKGRVRRDRRAGPCPHRNGKRGC